jgi:hypothetical protein
LYATDVGLIPTRNVICTELTGSITLTEFPVLDAAIKHPVVFVVVPLLFDPQSVVTGSYTTEVGALTLNN